MAEFINPYNFVRPDKNVLRNAFIPFNRFDPEHYSGQIAISIKSVDNIPIFTPDSEQKKYWIILDDNIKFDGIDLNRDYYFKIEDNELKKCDNLPEIDSINCYETSDDLLRALKERASWVKGKLKEIFDDTEEINRIRYIETEDPGDYEDKAHKIMKFCKDPEGKPILPSTTLKGLVRNLTEILSNSCFSFYDKKQIYYRLSPDDENNRREISILSNSAFFVKKIKSDRTAELVKLDSVKVNTSFFIENELKNNNPVWAAVVFDRDNKPTYIKRIGKKEAIDSCVKGLGKYFYGTKKSLTARSIVITSKNISSEKPAPFSYQATISIAGIPKKYNEPRLKNIRNQFLYARVQKKMVGPGGSFEKYYLKEINIKKEQLTSPGSDERIVQCKLKKSGGIETKTQDILFFEYGEQDLLKYVNQTNGEIIEKRIIEEYNEVLKQRKINLREENKDEPESLKEGDLIFYFYNGREEYISYTQIPRKKYNNSVKDIIIRDDNIPKTCIDIKNLCSVCNIFGSTELKDENKNIAISGKISFGLGRLINPPGKLEEEAPLKILASPKPSCTYFYLLDGDYNNTNSKIRGRKLYYHHSQDNLKYKRGPGDSRANIIIDNHNVSIEALKNFKFKSTIDFVNLSEYELGLILFALELKNRKKEKVYHKIGMGKPLGLGTIQIDIDEKDSFIINRKKRYSTFLTSDGEMETGKEPLNISEKIKEYKDEQIKIYNNDKKEKVSNFYEIPYISDLFNILEINSLPGDYPEIKYPRKTKNNEPRGFEWFVEEQQQKKPLSQAQFLPSPSKIRENNETNTLNEWS